MKNNIESYKNHIKSYKNYKKPCKKHIKTKSKTYNNLSEIMRSFMTGPVLTCCPES